MADVISLLRDLVALPSVNPSDGPPDDAIYGEGRVVEYLVAYLRRHGVDCVTQEVLPGRHNVLARVEGKSPEAIILEAHTDTVSGEGMTIPAFDPVIQDGRLYGRGACDDKSSLAAMAAALVRVAGDGAPPRTCILAATCDEEYRFSGIRRFVEQPEVVGLGPSDLRRAAACVGEPTGLQVVVAHKGACRWRVRTHGKAAHSSDPDAGDNAIYKMARVLVRLQEYAESLRSRSHHALVGGPTCSVGVVHGGTAVNVVPDLCEALIDRRLIPGEDGGKVEQEIRAFLQEGEPYELETLLVDWPLETPQDAQIALRAQAAVRAVRGEASVVGVPYGTDASKLDRAGVRSVVCGPGDIAQAHTASEWVELTQVEQAAEIYYRLLRD